MCGYPIQSGYEYLSFYFIKYSASLYCESSLLWGGMSISFTILLSYLGHFKAVALHMFLLT